MARKLDSRSTPVRSLGHDGATRPNLPTAELDCFSRDEEKRPTILRHPRDPTMDLNLAWKGQDEQAGRTSGGTAGEGFPP
jgi:adenine-specific DNA-methyltransferase